MGRLIEDRLVSYLAEITGETPRLEAVPDQLVSKLPLYLRQHYEFFRADLFGRRCILAKESSPNADLSPTQYGHEVMQLTQTLHGDIVLVLTKLPSYVRNRLVKQQIPFIVPGTQMFLPMLMTDLREQFPKPNDRMRSTLSAVSQLVVIYQILRGSLDETALGQIANRLGYSALAMSKTRDEWQTVGLCEAIRTWRTVNPHFKERGKNLGRKAEPLLA